MANTPSPQQDTQTFAVDYQVSGSITAESAQTIASQNGDAAGDLKAAAGLDALLHGTGDITVHGVRARADIKATPQEQAEGTSTTYFAEKMEASDFKGLAQEASWQDAEIELPNSLDAEAQQRIKQGIEKLANLDALHDLTAVATHAEDSDGNQVEIEEV